MADQKQKPTTKAAPPGNLPTGAPAPTPAPSAPASGQQSTAPKPAQAQTRTSAPGSQPQTQAKTAPTTQPTQTKMPQKDPQASIKVTTSAPQNQSPGTGKAQGQPQKPSATPQAQQKPEPSISNQKAPIRPATAQTQATSPKQPSVPGAAQPSRPQSVTPSKPTTSPARTAQVAPGQSATPPGVAPGMPGEKPAMATSGVQADQSQPGATNVSKPIAQAPAQSFQASVAKPQMPTSPDKPVVTPATQAATPPDEPLEFKGKSVESLEKRGTVIKLMIFVFAILVIVGLVIGGIYAYNAYSNQSKEDDINKEEPVDNPDDDKKDEPEPKPEDGDEDGIKDVWEEKYGLDINDPSDAQKDLDFDGLLNIDEFRYNTNPNENDTDNDGYSDGQEIKDGYNPLGPGKLEGAEDDDDDVDKSLAAFVAGNWSGSMVGKLYNFSNINIELRKDGTAIVKYQIQYGEDLVQNEGVGTFESNKETGVFELQIEDIQGIAESGQGVYLVSFAGNLTKSYSEVSGTWFIIPSSLTAPWMTQDKGTFSFKKNN